MIEENAKVYRKHLVQLAKDSEDDQAWAAERLEHMYKIELDPVLKTIQKGLLPDQMRVQEVLNIEREIQGIDPRFLPETMEYLCNINDFYPVLKEEKYVQNLEEKHSEINSKLEKPEGLTKKELSEFKKERSRIARKLYLYGH